MKPLGWVRWNGVPCKSCQKQLVRPTSVGVEAGAEAEAAGAAEAAAAVAPVSVAAADVHEPATRGAEAEVRAGQLAWAATGVVEAWVEASEAAEAAEAAAV